MDFMIKLRMQQFATSMISMKKQAYVMLFVCWILNSRVKRRWKSIISPTCRSETGANIVSVAPDVLLTIASIYAMMAYQKYIWIIASLVRKGSLLKLYWRSVKGHTG